VNFVQEHLVGLVDFRAFYASEGVVFHGKRALCPFHPDEHPSFDVDFVKGVYICRACGEGGDPVTFLVKRSGLSEAEAIADLKRRFDVNSGPPPVARRAVAFKEYQIRDHAGKLVALHRRTDFDDGSKALPWARPDDPSGLGGMPKAELPLYGSENLAGAASETLVLLVEGEKARDALAEREYLAVASVTGARETPGAAPLEVLRGRNVVLWPDHDKDGRAHMNSIAAALAGVAASVRVLTWGEQPKDDAFDFFARGCTTEQLDGLLAEAPPWKDEPSSPTPDRDSAASAKISADAWPTLSDEALHGLPGDIVRTIGPHTEADPVNVLIHCLAMFGNAVGPTPHAQVGARLHGANIFAVIVAETSHGRKGEGEGQARRVLASADPGWAKDQIVHGLSSGEGLIDAVRDLSKKEEEDGVAPRDRRLLAIETEFSGTLRMMRREGNALSSVIRQAWDSGNLRTMTKRSPLRATGAHVSIIGHSTAPELLRYMEGETENGFANRFLWICARRSHLLPDGGSLTDADLAPLYARVDKALSAGKITVEVKRDSAARALWHQVYPTLTAGHPGLFGAVTSRAEAQVLRLSLLYALFDSSKEIRVEHLKAALAVWDYAAASVRYIFGDLMGDPIADRVLRELRAIHPKGLTRTEITSDLFNRNVGAVVLERALLGLKRTGLAFEVRQETGAQGGRPSERWFATVSGK
jgi:hypothetical protein